MADIDETEEIAAEPAAPEEPIDADFEPAPRTSVTRKESRRGQSACHLSWAGLAIFANWLFKSCQARVYFGQRLPKNGQGTVQIL